MESGSGEEGDLSVLCLSLSWAVFSVFAVWLQSAENAPPAPLPIPYLCYTDEAVPTSKTPVSFSKLLFGACLAELTPDLAGHSVD